MSKVCITNKETTPLYWISGSNSILRVSQHYPFCKLKGNRHFRLLTLFPRSFRPPLANIVGEDSFYLGGALSVNELSENVSYECLSYVWGENNDTDCCLLYLDEHVIQINANLSLALQRLRLEDKPRVIWVDFCCINQRDQEERATQVGIMYQIFSKASRVVASLGDDADGSEHIPKFLIDIQAAHYQDLDIRPPRPGFPAPAWTEKDCIRLGLPPAGDDAWVRLEKFVSRPWFRRTWIIQEALAAKKMQIVCGRWGYPGAGLFDCLRTAFCRRLPLARSWRETMGPYGYEAVCGYQQIVLLLELGVCGLRDAIFEAPQERWPLVKIPMESRWAKASDNRDRVFALLNICADQEKLGLLPDYVEPYAETCRRVAQSLVRSGYGNIIVSAKCSLGMSTIKLPSWIPDWSLETPPKTMVAPDPNVVDDTRLEYVRCAGGDTHSIELGSDPSHLLVEAFVIDTLNVVDNFRPSGNVLSEFYGDPEQDTDYEFLCSLANMNPTSGGPGMDHEEFQMFRAAKKHMAAVKCWTETSPRYSHCDRTEVLWRTLTSDQELGSLYKAPSHYRRYCLAYFDLAEERSSFDSEQTSRVAQTRPEEGDDRAFEDGLTALMPEDMDTRIKQALVFVRTVAQCYDRRHPALTKTGYVLMRPPAVLPGDVVAVIKGVGVPVILRPVLDNKSTPSRFELLGTSYFYGFMDGEVLRSEEYKSEHILLV